MDTSWQRGRATSYQCATPRPRKALAGEPGGVRAAPAQFPCPTRARASRRAWKREGCTAPSSPGPTWRARAQQAHLDAGPAPIFTRHENHYVRSLKDGGLTLTLGMVHQTRER